MHRLASPPVPPTAGWKERWECGVRAILQSHSPTAQGRGGLQTIFTHGACLPCSAQAGKAVGVFRLYSPTAQGRGGLQTIFTHGARPWGSSDYIHPRCLSAVLGTDRQGRGGLQTMQIARVSWLSVVTSPAIPPKERLPPACARRTHHVFHWGHRAGLTRRGGCATLWCDAFREVHEH